MYEEKILPFTNNRYVLSDSCDILDTFNDREIINPFIKDDIKFIELDWFDGIRAYDLGQVIAITGFSIKIPKEHLHLVEVIYRDNNKHNTFLSNLYYRFKNGPIEVSHKKGFFYIPYYTRYAVNLKGEVFDLKNNNLQEWNYVIGNKKKNITGGYFRCCGYSDIYKNNKSLLRHRALGLTFLHYKDSPFILVINHKDGIPGNDSLENLEWVTRAANNQHAYDINLFPNKTTKVIYWNLGTNEFIKFNSIMDCARALNKRESFVHIRAKRSNVRYSDNIAIKHDDGLPWPDLLPEVVTAQIRNEVFIRNVFTGEITLTNTVASAAELTGISEYTVASHCVNMKLKPVGGYNFRYHDYDSAPVWPVHSERNLLVYKKHKLNPPNYAVIVNDIFTKNIEFYESVDFCAQVYNLSTSAVVGRCKSGISINGKIFSSYKILDNIK